MARPKGSTNKTTINNEDVINDKKTDVLEKEIKTQESPVMNEEMFQQMYEMMKDKIKKEIEEELKQNKTNIPMESKQQLETPTKFTKIMLSDESIQKDFVKVEAVTDNVNFYSSKTNTNYKWAKKGDIELLNIAEIRTMESDSLRFLHTPWLIVHDNRVIEAYGLENIMEAIEKLKDIESICKMSQNEIESIFKILPKDFKHSFSCDILSLIVSKQLTDIGVISTLEKVLDCSFRDYLF